MSTFPHRSTHVVKKPEHHFVASVTRQPTSNLRLACSLLHHAYSTPSEGKTGGGCKPRHQFIYTSADSRRPCRSARSPERSTHRFARVPRVFCLCTAYLLVELRFLRHGRLHSAYMSRKP